jgi:hypothetical protein
MSRERMTQPVTYGQCTSNFGRTQEGIDSWGADVRAGRSLEGVIDLLRMTGYYDEERVYELVGRRKSRAYYNRRYNKKKSKSK